MCCKIIVQRVLLTWLVEGLPLLIFWVVDPLQELSALKRIPLSVVLGLSFHIQGNHSASADP
jgi:hypothetical protein